MRKQLLLFLFSWFAITSVFGQTTNPTPTKFTNGLGADTYFNLPTQTSPPTSTQIRAGSMYHNSATGLYMRYNGTVWQSVAMTQTIADSLVAIRASIASKANTSDVNTSLNLKADKSTTVNGQPLSGNVTLTKSDVGLGNVDNTSDVNKPISTLQQAALDGKVPITRTVNSKALSSDIVINKSDVGLGSVDNTPDINKPISTSTQMALDGKVPIARTVNSKALSSNIVLNKSDFTDLNNVDNTSDSNKPISAATQTSLNLKANTSTVTALSDSVLRAPKNLYDLTDITMARDNLRVQGRLRSVVAKTGLLNAGIPVTINYMPFGDSIRQDLLSAVFLTTAQQAFGPLTSQHGGGNQLGVAYTTTNGTVRTGSQVILNSLTSSGTTATATVTSHGLSNGNMVTISGATNTVYNGTYVISGVTTNTFNYTIASSTTSPDPSPNIYYSAAQDYNKWVTGSFYTVPTSGTLTYAKGSGAIGFSSGFTKLKVFYISEVGGGTFKVQTSTDDVTYTDVSGYTSVSASGTQDNLGILTIPNPSGTTTVYIRVVGLTGSVKIAGLGYENISGSKYTDMVGDGGLLLKNMALTPERIWAAYLLDFQPDVITEYFADDVDADYIAALTTMQGYFSKYAPNATVIYPSVYNARKDDPGYTPTPPFSQRNSTQNAANLAFLKADTNPTEKYYWDAAAYVGTWASSSARGMHDASIVSNITALTISGSTITVTTAASHTLSSGSVVRIVGASPNSYNGLYLSSTVTGSNTLTVTAGSVVPTVVGTGGNIASVDGIHLGGDGGRTVLTQQFLRDFPELTGFSTNYPYRLGDGAIRREAIVMQDGSKNVTGDLTSTSTTATTGAGPVTTPSNTAALKVYGGFHAGGVLKSDLGLQIGSGNPGPTLVLSQFTYSGTNAQYSNLISNLSHTVSITGSYNQEGIRSNLTQTFSGTASNNSGNLNGNVSQFTWAGSGTGSATGRSYYGSMTNQSSGTANTPTVFDSYLQNNAGATMSSAKGFNANAVFNGTISGNQPRAFNVQTGYNMYYAFYNEGSGKIYSGFGNFGVGTSAPTAILDVAQSSSGAGTVTTTAGSGTVTGVGTSFNTTFKIGGTITVNAETRTVSAIASATSMTTDNWTGSNAAQSYAMPVGEVGSRFIVQGNGRINVGNTGLASATLDLKPGSALANNAPLKFRTGTLLTTSEPGAIEFNTDSLYYTQTSSNLRSPLATTLIADQKIAVSRTAIQNFTSAFTSLYKTASYNVTSTDFAGRPILSLLVDASAGTTVITLPLASTMSGKIINVKRLDATGSTLTISGNGVNIDNTSTTTLIAQNENIQIKSVSIDGGTTFRYIVLARMSDLSGYIPATRTITINGVTYDLSANRSWATGTVTSITPGAGFASVTPITAVGTMNIDTAGTIGSKPWVTARTYTKAQTDAKISGASGIVDGGVYTPTIAVVSNITSSFATQFTWSRVGNIVTVFGKVNINATAVGTAEFDLNLPYGTLFVNADLNGTGSTQSDMGIGVVVNGVSATNKARVQVMVTNALVGRYIYISFQYLHSNL